MPNPDGICTAEGFAYTRLGVRIPTLAISPWIAKGTLVSAPPVAPVIKPSTATSAQRIAFADSTITMGGEQQPEPREDSGRKIPLHLRSAPKKATPFEKTISSKIMNVQSTPQQVVSLMRRGDWRFRAP